MKESEKKKVNAEKEQDYNRFLIRIKVIKENKYSINTEYTIPSNIPFKSKSKNNFINTKAERFQHQQNCIAKTNKQTNMV